MPAADTFTSTVDAAAAHAGMFSDYSPWDDGRPSLAELAADAAADRALEAQHRAAAAERWRQGYVCDDPWCQRTRLRRQTDLHAAAGCTACTRYLATPSFHRGPVTCLVLQLEAQQPHRHGGTA